MAKTVFFVLWIIFKKKTVKRYDQNGQRLDFITVKKKHRCFSALESFRTPILLWKCFLIQCYFLSERNFEIWQKSELTKIQ